MATAEPTNSQLKAMFRNINLSTDVAMELVTRQGINSIKDIKTLTQDRVTCLCSIIRKPGGGTNEYVVFESAENLFLLLVYYCQHQYRVTRDTDHYLVTLVNLRALCEKLDIKKD